MPTKRSSDRSSRDRRIVLVVAIIGLLSIAFWLWPTSRVTLDDGGYQATMALYRICNQQDELGLEEMERKLNESPQLQNLSPSSQQTLGTILVQAKAGDWKDAAIMCRKLMDDQVKR